MIHGKVTTAAAAIVAIAAANGAAAHPSVVGHAHPHGSLADSTLLGVDTLALAALALVAALGVGLTLMRSRK